MNTLANYLVEQVLAELSQGVIVMLPGGFKPPHIGHVELAKRYASQPNVSEVRILIGPKERDGITMDQSMEIWKLLLGGAPNIKVERAPNDNPMRAAYEYIETAEPGTYTLGSSSKGKDYERVKMFVAGHAPGTGKYHRPEVSVVELPINTSPLLYKGRTDNLNGQGISASVLRADLAANNYDNFKTNYPGISDNVTKTIYSVLKKNDLSEAVVSDWVNKLKAKFKEILQAVKEEGVETKKAFTLLIQAAQGKKKLTDEEKAWVGNQMKDALKAAGLVAASILPGGTIYFVLIRLLKLEKYTMPDRFLSKNAASAGTLSLMEKSWMTPQGRGPNFDKGILQIKSLMQTFFERLKSAPRDLQRDFAQLYAHVTKTGRLLQSWELDQITQKLEPILIKSGFNVKLDKKELPIALVQALKTFPKLQARVPQQVLAERMLLKEGGAAGHMTHPYEDLDLTFGDARNMIDAALSGKVEFAQEKLDGQNLMVTYKDGKVRAARNKGQLKNYAENSITADQLDQMMAGKGAVQTAFVEAMRDMESAINKLDPTQKEQFFQNGKRFINFEVLFPGTTNVVPYGATQLRLHGFKEYDQDGNVVDEDSEGAVQLQAAIDKVQASNQKTYQIRHTDPITLSKTKDYEKQKDELLKQLETIRKTYDLKENDKTSLYFQAWWKNYIEQRAKELGYEIDDNTLQQLINRWGFGNKEVNIKNIRAMIKNVDFLKWVDDFDKNGVSAQQKEAKRPLENLFLKLGVYVLQNIQQLVSINPNDTVQKMRDELAYTIKGIRAAAASPEMQDDDKGLKFLKRELQRLQDLGGFKAIVPLEGVVFKYNGKIYKLTGAFAPINQIIGYLKFQR